MYEEAIRTEWYNAQRSAEEIIRMEAEFHERLRATRLKMIAFTTAFVLLYLFSELVYSIYRAPEHVVYDEVTGKQMVISKGQFAYLQDEKVRRYNQQRRENAVTQSLDNELNRLIEEHERKKRSERPS